MTFSESVKKYMVPNLKLQDFELDKAKSKKGLFHFIFRGDKFRNVIAWDHAGKKVESNFMDIVATYKLENGKIVFSADLQQFHAGINSVFDWPAACHWYWDNDQELIGLLEKQVDIISEYIIPIFDESNTTNYMEILEEKKKEQNKILTEKYNGDWAEYYKEYYEPMQKEWQKKRYYPNKWK